MEQKRDWNIFIRSVLFVLGFSNPMIAAVAMTVSRFSAVVNTLGIKNKI
ncbi:hypothetical protein HYU10_01980, partial [Candidatus Woesearchaeota archaeon]|nr:hypothetical protein [Candidatus Woesearchaeota archaeon]